MKQTGLETRALKCLFCNLEVKDYKELDYLKIIPNAKDKDKIIIEYTGDIECHKEEPTLIIRENSSKDKEE